MKPPASSCGFGGTTSAIILAGGLGTRLRPVCADKPKPMVSVLGRPFLGYIVEYLQRQGIRDIIISTGYKGSQIEEYFSKSKKQFPSVQYTQETVPLGTGGALAFAAHHAAVQGFFLACNGDSLAPFMLGDLEKAVAMGADAAMVAVRIQDGSRFGTLTVDDSGMLRTFSEKSSGTAAGLVNAGIYLLHSHMLPLESSVSVASMERDYFPQWLSEGKKIRVISTDGPFIDIGTPESLDQAADFIQKCGLFMLG